MESKYSGFLTPKKHASSVSARKIKDCAADWHNLILKWETYNNDSFNAANKIASLKISTNVPDKVVIDKTLPNNENVIRGKELEKLCSELICILENMEKIQVKMEKMTTSLKGICELEAYQFSGEVSKPIHFHTWQTTLFYETSLKMLEMYKAEVLLKRTIVEDIAHTLDEDLQMIYLSCWLYQPYIDNNIKVLLESMLLETGHRSI
ncbi:hypothetical protein GDO86_016072 [Hymenochirus boettgeri]|uniref:Cyclin-dependent kinase 2-interacting protein n=1 Tax=Hymenochirus boettgeri TaxID=247094 RepID=A0A8T2K0U4_9PIPI|nr:hypothetical protein GDO86_016072 [Hymenochirus boettgeri]